MSDRGPGGPTEAKPSPTRRELGAVFWASQVAVWAWLTGRSLSQLGESEGTPWWWVHLLFVVGGPCAIVVDAVMLVRSYRAGRRGLLHTVPLE